MKYPKPKIILIDLNDECGEKLKNSGYNVGIGSFGRPYKVTKSDDYDFIFADCNLPNLREQDIVIIDLQQKKLLDEAPEHKVTRDSDLDVKVRLLNGFVDPRPLTMLLRQKEFKTIWLNGGIFIVFADPFVYQEIYSAKKDKLKHWVLKEELEINLWSFLPLFGKEQIIIESSAGNEIVNMEKPNHWTPIISKYYKDAHYTATIHKSYNFNGEFLPITLNKYKEPIAGLITTNTKSFMVIFPQLSNKGDLILELLSGLLPELKSEMFPYNEGSNWINKEEYDLQEIKQLKYDRDKLIDEKEKLLVSSNQKIEDAKLKYSFLYRTLTESGEELVNAIEELLIFIGFNNVKNIDKEIDSTDVALPKQEDLQILDSSPSLILEIKGISGLPREDDTFQIVKYITRRMKEWKKTDVRGLVIVNHQRNLPSLNREISPFTAQQITDAEHNDFGLISSWDLFLLLKGMLKYNWTKDKIRNKFCKSGQIDKIPEHYVYVGVIDNYWEHHNVVGIKIESESIKIGDRLSYILDNDYLEEEIHSLQVDQVDRNEAAIGELVGIKTIFTKIELKKKIKVYKVIR